MKYQKKNEWKPGLEGGGVLRIGKTNMETPRRKKKLNRYFPNKAVVISVFGGEKLFISLMNRSSWTVFGEVGGG